MAPAPVGEDFETLSVREGWMKKRAGYLIRKSKSVKDFKRKKLGPRKSKAGPRR